MGVMVFDRKRIVIPIASDPVFAQARDHALVKAGYANPEKHRNRVERVRSNRKFREFTIWVRVQL